MSQISPDSIARKDRLMKAFWAPAFEHADDIFAGKVPSAEDMTAEYMHAFYTINFLSLSRRGYPEVTMGPQKVIGHDALKEAGKKIAEQDPRKMQDINAAMRHARRRIL